MDFTSSYTIDSADAYHREQVSRDFRAARESAAAVRRMLTLVSDLRHRHAGSHTAAHLPHGH